MASMTTEFYDNHPHPLFDVDNDRRIIRANPAAVRAFGTDLVGKTCCDVLFGTGNSCNYGCISRANERGYCTVPVVGLHPGDDATIDEHHLSLFPYPARQGCHFAVHPVPGPIGRIREVREITNRIVESQSVDEVIEHFRDFLTSDQWRRAYRVREYKPDKPIRPQSLTCVWHEQNVEAGRPYIANLLGSKILRSSLQGMASFYAIDKLCISLVARTDREVTRFRHDFDARPGGPGLFVATAELFSGLTLIVPTAEHSTVAIFQNENGDHCFLDVPFGNQRQVVRKLSITPQGRRVEFTREEVEEIFTLHAVANTQIENLAAREREKKIAKLDAIHEVSQPAFLALASIEWLRKKDRENHRGPDFDQEAFYAKKNAEAAIRLVAFLNESPLIARGKPAASYSPMPINLLADVVAPIVNMVRHEEYLQERQRKKRGLELRAEFLDDLQLPTAGHDMQQVQWKIRSQNKVSYDGMLDTISLFVNQYRLQQVFYNLFSNASKFRRTDRSLQLTVKVWRDTQVLTEHRPTWQPFYVVDIEDDGIGVPVREEEDIFALGARGSTAIGIRGTGRGLYFVRETMLSIGGDVFVSQNSGPTCFRLLFPAVCAERDWHEDQVVATSRDRVAAYRELMRLQTQDRTKSG